MVVKDNPLVSIIMNCFNGEFFLRTALDSIILQFYENWEVIFWDNLSTDQSAKIFLGYAVIDFGISIHHHTLFNMRHEILL